MDPKDTAPAETVAVPSTESTATPQATDPVQGPAKEHTPTEAKPVVEESPEELRRKLLNVEQERNLLRNKTEKFERDQEESRLAELSEVDRLKEELAGYQQKEAYQTANNFRKSVIDEYLKDDPAALKAAKALIAKNPSNFTWGEGADEEQARNELVSQLDSLKEVLGSVTPTVPVTNEPVAQVNPNNPAPLDDRPIDRKTAVEQAAKSGNFAAVLQSIPSVAAQIKKVTYE